MKYSYDLSMTKLYVDRKEAIERRTKREIKKFR